jgi:hypothetical protein
MLSARGKLLALVGARAGFYRFYCPMSSLKEALLAHSLRGARAREGRAIAYFNTQAPSWALFSSRRSSSRARFKYSVRSES